MIRCVALIILIMVVLAPAAAQQKKCEHASIHATFVASNGNAIELDTRARTLRLPHSRANVLYDCGTKAETCLTDHHGFAFAFARQCDEVGLNHDSKNTKLTPKIVSVLHGNLWVVFDDSPNFLFHYVIPKGIVGIYIGTTPSFDFRSLFRDQNTQIANLNAMEYHITSHSDAVAACSR